MGKSKEGNGLHLVAWNKVCKPKQHGGLGINKVRNINKALLSKWLWRFGPERDNLWRKVIASKYGVVTNWEAETSSRPYGCSCWKAIMKVIDEFK